MTMRPNYGPAFPLSIGLISLLLLIAGIGFWSVHSQISGAVVATGTIEVENNRQVVQHAEGGVVGSIQARDGDSVQRDELLVRLDDTLLRSDLAVVELQLVELAARRARLEAERDGATEIAFSKVLLSSSEESATEQIEGQRTLFQARRNTLERELSQVAERIKQSGTRIRGTEAQIDALETQARLVADELSNQQTLLGKGLVPAQRVSTLQREAARLAGEIGELTARVGEFRAQIAGDELERIRRVSERRENAISELRDIQFRELELTEKRKSLRGRLTRLDIRAPVTGVVYGTTVFAEKAVIQPAEPLMYIVPQDQPLVVTARVDAIHIDQVYLGQPATLRFPAFNQRLTPETPGQVTKISADILRDEFTGQPYYRVSVIPLEATPSDLNDQVLLPGMPVETFLRTDERTPLSYLTKPLTDYFGRAFRES